MTQHVVLLLIMNMESVKSDVNGWKKKNVFFFYFVLEGDKTPHKMIQKRIGQIYIGSD